MPNLALLTPKDWMAGSNDASVDAVSLAGTQASMASARRRSLVGMCPTPLPSAGGGTMASAAAAAAAHRDNASMSGSVCGSLGAPSALGGRRLSCGGTSVSGNAQPASPDVSPSLGPSRAALAPTMPRLGLPDAAGGRGKGGGGSIVGSVVGTLATPGSVMGSVMGSTPGTGPKSLAGRSRAAGHGFGANRSSASVIAGYGTRGAEQAPHPVHSPHRARSHTFSHLLTPSAWRQVRRHSRRPCSSRLS